MSILCTISGQTPEEPVVSKTGYVFEKRLIEKHILNYGICPVSGEVLTLQDLYPLKNEQVVKPRPITASSIPGLLSILQTEWDAIISEMFTLRTHVNDIRNQLTHSLYQYDAATRVIAKLLKEKNDYKEEVKKLRNQILSIKSGNDLNEFEVGLSEDLLNEMQEVAKNLLMTRKKRNIEHVSSAEQWKEVTNTNEFDVHSAAIPGVTCLSLDINELKYSYYDDHKNHSFFSGGMDGNVYYVSLEQSKVLAKLQGHLKKVTAIVAHPKYSLCISGANDKTVRIWKGDVETNEFATAHVIAKHKDQITSLALHPMENYFVSSSKDNVWILNDLETSRSIKICKDTPSPFRQLAIHPDGIMLGIGCEDSNIHIFDMKSQEYKASLSGHTSHVSYISFSENGYYLASCSKDKTVKLWDLRKAQCFQTIDVEELPRSICFDFSGKYLSLAAGNDVHVFNFEAKTKAVLVNTLSAHTDAVTQTCFGSRTAYLLSSSMDKTVKVWS
ncbi:pre-mRNA-processing factor 19, putative [Plasmodium vivax]|uniref:Pre-mRNA-processing factor 19 n=6 Tax=Plasmodium vivax TaxID=5855 RepID=A5KBA1_PLAVS|nr:WD domain, G-beta repeat domain containing protein [Plasmodium vivax]KMZ80707.1 WD domain, G-beta repeat domain-containing protein [Plasmodium vivax India VII]KMZ86783.1 WD domain, G-beta repeat domain-containing protein [Plasmodium vivax Brazil I]KMZ93611.1 WD domain, G-beta repeat domain-containing protein [Plasmodium vivax Mauritania I]KMZ99899.1 WD domain, G-beta repeat domain-containing protein [Plasmodium vivax North Korean]EDL43379.1 WD domain, G-beta repeat domain containing protein|eukprot:XP_001613106.1 WD domain, G-beta repeat domain containing protein [Plasmodium vivax Sal-1]